MKIVAHSEEEATRELRLTQKHISMDSHEGKKRINNVIAIYFVQGLLPVQDKKTTCQKFGASIQQLHERVSRN